MTHPSVTCRAGHLMIAPLQTPDDVAALKEAGVALVLSMTTDREMIGGAQALGDALATQGIAWHYLPISDFGAPNAATAAKWHAASDLAHQILSQGGTVLAHCRGGCGRSGMAVLRIMVEAGENPDDAVARLRAVRPCAVETPEQFTWGASAA